LGRTKKFVFYEGPPTANGKPGIHHLEARAFKDVIPRYKTMRGYFVRRKAGWDTHGLPVELEVEKELGLKSKKEIEEFGVAEFNEKCQKSVWKYLDVWNNFTERIGFWLDQKNPYITYDKDYMESVWHVVKKIDEQKLLYKDYKVVPWCPRCGTALSSHELAQGYENIKDLSVYVKFKILASLDASAQALGSPRPSADGLRPDHSQKHAGSANVCLLAWTTTPWTLLGNVALAVGKNMDYVKIQILGGRRSDLEEPEFFILAKARLSVIKGEYKILEEMKGKDLLGLEYEPLFPYFKDAVSGMEKEKLNKAYKVYPADFVTTEEGTGIVHTAVMYGQDDFVLGTEIDLPKFHLVGEDGSFLNMTGPYAGKFVRDENTAVDIIKDLASRGLLFEKEKYEHTYPFCWRCKTALIYFARDSWYVKMSQLRDKLVKENKKINWEPDYIKNGRFGQWLEEIKDWAISRERYWGTPLPVWLCEKCGEKKVIGSIAELKSNVKKSGNRYFVMRHGEAENNVNGVLNSDLRTGFHLTEKGKNQVRKSVKILKENNFDYIFSSPLLRTLETANLVKSELELSIPIVVDNRLREFGAGNFEGEKVKYYQSLFKREEEEFTKRPGSVESFNDVRKRVMNFLYEIDSKYANKKILIISHGDPVRAMNMTVGNFSVEQAIKFPNGIYPHKGEITELNFAPLPHNENYELDLHKPYIDEIKLNCVCGAKMQRVKEVMDVWLDSGTMPFSQDHWPFKSEKRLNLENSKRFDLGKFSPGRLQYPADFISEAIDQTRGWFYTLLAVGVLMKKGTPFKNVICLGHVLDAEGKKMSKSIGNIVDPWLMMEKYGADTLRLWMYSVNQPGESKNFDEKTVLELHRQVFGLLYNVLAFYELYRDEKLERRSDLGNLKRSDLGVLDQWILIRLNELENLCTENLDHYRLLEPARAIRDFINDLSTWYLRRSRDRIKEGDREAKTTLYFILKNLAKIMAPFAPFTAEDIWQRLKNDSDEESVHLAKWPHEGKKWFGLFLRKDKILGNMETVRKIVTLGLEARQRERIPIRQPLSRIEIKNYGLSDEYKILIKDELNIKEIIETKQTDDNILLFTIITPELKEEGNYRELVRTIQDLRKKNGLTPNDFVSLSIETGEAGKKLIQKFEKDLKKVALLKEIKFSAREGEAMKINDLEFKIKIEK
jgi:isoleucyl-tRNA synthetase